MQFIKTELGHKAFKERSPLFLGRQRSAFILFDGHQSLDQVLATTSGIGITRADVDYMVEQGFLAAVVVASPEVSESAAALLMATPAGQERSSQQRYSEGKLIATRLTAQLGLRGFRLNLAVEAAAGYADLLALLPKIQDAVGSKACQELTRALQD
jgi:hypothetical protein